MVPIKPLFVSTTHFNMKYLIKITSLFLSLSLSHAQEPISDLFQKVKGTDQTGDWIRDHYQYKVGEVDELEVNIDYGIGELAEAFSPSEPIMIINMILLISRIIQLEGDSKNLKMN